MKSEQNSSSTEQSIQPRSALQHENQPSTNDDRRQFHKNEAERQTNEGYPLVRSDWDTVPYIYTNPSIKVVHHDILVLGAGMAGQRAANAAKTTKSSLKVAMLSCAADLAHGGCSWKTHGINAAMNPNDCPESHFEDTMRGGGMISFPELARAVCEGAPEAIREMEELGVKFDKIGDRFDSGTYGGSTVGRSVHAGDQAGNMIMNRLREQGRSLGVEAYNLRLVVTIIIVDKRAIGALCIDLLTGKPEIHLAPKVISALGAGLCTYPIRTIQADKQATGLVSVLDAGGELVDMEMTQFHPTGLRLPDHPGDGEIIEEEVRAQGAQLFNKDGHRFMFDWDERGEIATRDIVARASYHEIMNGRGTPEGGVILSLKGQSAEFLADRFPFMGERVRAHGIDLTTCGQLIISPAAHFLMGGILIDKDGRSLSIKGLYACGEDGAGFHGGNRLGGNGVADALVVGKRAGVAAANDSDASDIHFSTDVTVPLFAGFFNEGREKFDAELKNAMWTSAGPIRHGDHIEGVEAQINQGINLLARQKVHIAAENYTLDHQPAREQYQHLRLAQGILRASSERTNSVGAHYRVDAEDDQRIYNTFVKLEGDHMVSRRAYRDGTMKDALAPSEAA